MLALRLEGTLEEVFAGAEHLVDEILGEAVVLEVEEADVLGSLANLTGTLLRVGGEEAEIDHRDGDISAGEGVGGILGHVRWKEEGGTSVDEEEVGLSGRKVRRMRRKKEEEEKKEESEIGKDEKAG